MHHRSFAWWLGVAFWAMTAWASAAQGLDRPEGKQAKAVSGPYGIISTVAGDGWGGFYGDGGVATKGELHDPLGVAVDAAGNLYIADSGNNVIRKVAAATGDISTVAGTLEAGYAGDKGPATKAMLFLPTGVAVDSTGNLYIADSANNVIREVSAGTGTITTVAGNGFGGGPFHSCGLSGDGGPATEAELCWPQSVAVDAKGNLYITDSGNGLIREVNAKTHVITTVAGDPQSGFSGFLANANPATIVHLTDPLGMTVDGDGNFYFVEPLFCVVWEVKAANGYIYAVAGDYTCAQGEDGVKATSTSLGSVSGVAVDSAGDLYVAENGAQLVRRVDGKTGLLTTAAGALINPISDIAGTPGYTGDGGLATLAELDGPYGVATDGNLYITDSENNAVRKVTATTAVMTAAPVATPAAPAPGLGFGATQEVTLSDGTAGATIYYTTDGTVPTTGSTRYTGQIQLSETTTLTAFATSAGAANSSALQARFVQVAMPKISPDGGTFSTAQTVTLSDSTPGVAIYYTTDGSDPATSSSAKYYWETFQVSGAATVKAVAALNGGYGRVATAQFLPAAAPAVTTGSTSKIAATTATLNGTVNPDGLATEYWFTYGTSCGSAVKTPQQALAAGATADSVSVNLTGLTKGTKYCVQLLASNSKGTNSGQAASFTTAE